MLEMVSYQHITPLDATIHTDFHVDKNWTASTWRDDDGTVSWSLDKSSCSIGWRYIHEDAVEEELQPLDRARAPAN